MAAPSIDSTFILSLHPRKREHICLKIELCYPTFLPASSFLGKRDYSKSSCADLLSRHGHQVVKVPVNRIRTGLNLLHVCGSKGWYESVPLSIELSIFRLLFKELLLSRRN
ncbi:hypothetical protein NPIL_274951 [Nephila pilipes]|uniref:Uncharacterized protein n=1 Tax=Nephila pilipes TaxID=299642 RepID=A0A8X6UBM3_NEPPI|nr:hypothetical protein NPIL_274951 [Nephila pilipes]